MSNDEVMTLLDTLLEVERAGAKALAVVLKAYPAGDPAREKLPAIRAEEAKNCTLLIRLIEGGRSAEREERRILR
jgi:hypothetical protein